MAVAYRGKSFVFNSTAGLTTVAPAPSGILAGDRLVAVVGSVASSPTITDPAGGTWAKLAEFAPGSTLKTAVYARDAVTGDASASWTWTWSASGRNFGYVVAYSGVDTTVQTLAQPVEGSAANPCTTPAVGLDTGDWLITVAAGRQNPGTDDVKDWTIDDSSDVERFDLYSTNTGTAAKLTAALWDSGRGLDPVATDRIVQPNLTLAQYHAWSIRLAAPQTGGSTGTGGNPWSYVGIPQR